MSAAIELALQLLLKLLGKLDLSSAIVTEILDTLIQWLPLIEQEAATMMPYVTRIIELLSQSGDVTDEQRAMMAQINKTSDDDFDAAYAAYRAAHPAT